MKRICGSLFDTEELFMNEKLKSIAPPEVDSDEAFFADVFGEASGSHTSNSLAHISNLVSQARLTEAAIIVLEEKVKMEKDTLRTMLEVTIPEAMLGVGMRDIGLSDGTRVKVEPFHRGAITEKTKAAAHAWLETNGFGGLIKKDVTVSFGKDVDGFDGFSAYVREMGLASKEKIVVHPQTLGAFIRNQAEKGEPVPQDLFNAYSGQAAKLSKSFETVPFND